ncbi:DNA-3-methyladenine glycosylase [Nocardioides sp. R-C-SC26]|uniref:DNA-3-methyladenine glycosylase n=1 Tax=Nocardioides sp. R-C-SC26 TaxID=2870414 RepID=UPI001E4B6C52|nr:DNA-3-methyladenine glycosylase [Nocardioides sp. R-C-SC26]
MGGWPELRGAAASAAPQLLGAVLRKGDVSVRITEVEAYQGTSDPASHAALGPTPRNAPMFGPPGRLYVYLSYGMHHCANIVTGPEGEGGGVLLRAGEVVEGIDVARSRRRPDIPAHLLARGPGNLGRALGIELDDAGSALDRPPFALALATTRVRYCSGPRVGVRLAADRPWRFWLPDEPSVSAYRRHPRAGEGTPDLASGRVVP